MAGSLFRPSVSAYHRLWIAPLLAACGLLFGCERSPIQNPTLSSSVPPLRHSSSQSSAVLGSNGEAVYPAIGSVGGSGGSSLVEPDGPGYYHTEDGHKIALNYYTVYADIYWKLNWIRTQLVKGIVPPQFDKKLQRLRKEMTEMTRNIRHDGNYTVADEALRHLEKGLEHYRAQQELAAAGAMTASAPWRSGSPAMQQFIDSGGFGFGGKSIANSPAAPAPHISEDDPTGSRPTTYSPPAVREVMLPSQERAVEIALAYADRYSASPEELMRTEWQQANVLTNRLRDQLWLMNRPENRDNSTIVTVQPDLNPSAISGDTAPARPEYTKGGTDLPTGSGPVDPFAAGSFTRRN